LCSCLAPQAMKEMLSLHWGAAIVLPDWDTPRRNARCNSTFLCGFRWWWLKLGTEQSGSDECASKGKRSTSHAKRSSSSRAFRMSVPCSGAPILEGARAPYAAARTATARALHSSCRRRTAGRESLSLVGPITRRISLALKRLTLSRWTAPASAMLSSTKSPM